jgi:hypothetical protein
MKSLEDGADAGHHLGVGLREEDEIVEETVAYYADEAGEYYVDH